MATPPPDPDDRRRDARVVIAAQVRLSPVGQEEEIRADLVDVSAGGVRVRGPGPFREGTAVRIEILLDRSGGRAGGEVQLRGQGVVVRTAQPVGETPVGSSLGTVSEGRPSLDTALRFTGPLELREPFQQLLVF